MFEMKDFLAARPITPTVATTRFQTSTPVQAYRDLDLIGKRTYRPAEDIAAAMPWPDNIPRRAPRPELSMEQLIATPSRREPSFNLLNTPLADQPIPRLPPPPVPTAADPFVHMVARKRGVWPSRAPSEPTRSHIAQLDLEGPVYRGQRNPFDATMTAKSPIMEPLNERQYRFVGKELHSIDPIAPLDLRPRGDMTMTLADAPSILPITEPAGARIRLRNWLADRHRAIRSRGSLSAPELESGQRRALERIRNAGQERQYIARGHPRLSAFGADVRRHGGRGLQALADSAGRVGRVAARAGRYAASQIPGALVGGTAAGLGAYYGTRSAPPTPVAPSQPVHVAPTPPVHVGPTPAYVAPD